MYMYKRVVDGLKVPVALMIDVLAERSVCIIIFKAFGATEAASAGPVESNLHFQGHLHCHLHQNTFLTLHWSLKDQGQSSKANAFLP